MYICMCVYIYKLLLETMLAIQPTSYTVVECYAVMLLTLSQCWKNPKSCPGGGGWGQTST